MATIYGTAGDDKLDGTTGPDMIYGLAGDDSIDGGLGIDSLFGGDGNDIFFTAHNIDSIDGGAGRDTVIFARSRGEHTIVKTESGYTIEDFDSSAPYISIERLWFTDGKVALDFAQGEAARNTALVIGAAFDAPALAQHPDWVGIGLQLFDSGQTLSQVCALVAQYMGLSDTDFVTTVYSNVVGLGPDATALATYVGMLQSGTTQRQLLELAAMVDLNTININLVGLQESGLPFLSP